MRPSVLLQLHRIHIREATSRFAVANLRVFGLVLHGQDAEGSALTCWLIRFRAQRCSIWVACRMNWKNC